MVEGGPLPGIDFCEHGARALADGALPPWETVRGCPVCLRRWRIAEARLRGWTPLPTEAVYARFEPMAARLLAGRSPGDDAEERGFYAFLAAHPEAARDFAVAVAVAAPGKEAAVAPPRDFGWRARFAELVLPPPPAPTPATITRIWQWRMAGEAFAREGRSFVAGETPPPFVAAPPDLRGGGRWVREGPGATEPLQRQVLGPVLFTARPGPQADEVALTLRLREVGGAARVEVRLSAGLTGPEEAGATQRLVLSDERREVTVLVPRADYAAFQIAIDTAW